MDETYTLPVLGVPELKTLHSQRFLFYANCMCTVDAKVKCIFKEKLVFNAASVHIVKSQKHKVTSIKSL
jgi:hypothetical protein